MPVNSRMNDGRPATMWADSQQSMVMQKMMRIPSAGNVLICRSGSVRNDSQRVASRLANRGASGQIRSSGCPCPGWAARPAGLAGCWRRDRGRMLEECLRGPARERDGVVPRQAGDVDEPDDRLDADGGADADHQLAELLVGEVTADAVWNHSRIEQPIAASLGDGRAVFFCGIARNQAEMLDLFEQVA